MKMGTKPLRELKPETEKGFAVSFFLFCLYMSWDTSSSRGLEACLLPLWTALAFPITQSLGVALHHFLTVGPWLVHDSSAQ